MHSFISPFLHLPHRPRGDGAVVIQQVHTQGVRCRNSPIASGATQPCSRCRAWAISWYVQLYLVTARPIFAVHASDIFMPITLVFYCIFSRAVNFVAAVHVSISPRFQYLALRVVIVTGVATFNISVACLWIFTPYYAKSWHSLQLIWKASCR